MSVFQFELYQKSCRVFKIYSLNKENVMEGVEQTTRARRLFNIALRCSIGPARVFLGEAETQENLAAVADAASLCFFGFFSRKSSITQKVLVRLISF